MFLKKINVTSFIFFCLFLTFIIKSTELNILDGSQIKFELLEKNFESSFFLEKLSFASDVPFQNSEFLYLTGLKECSQVSIDELKNAFFYLQQKNRFESIDILVNEGKSGKHLHFILKGFYIFSKLKIDGFLIDKDRYWQYYALEPGEKFDNQKHLKSIQRMKDELARHGYFKPDINIKFDYNELNKSILVKINIHKGDQFWVKNVLFDYSDNYLNTKDFELYKQKIEEKFLKKFLKKNYTWNKIRHEKNKLLHFLQNEGFILSDIKIQKNINDDNSLDLQVIISLKQRKIWNIKGNSFFSKKNIINFLLDKGQYIFDIPPGILAQEFCQLYYRNGFWESKVNITNDKEFFNIDILEGPRAEIEKIQIIGSKFLSSNNIINDFFKLLLIKKCIIKENIEQAINNLNAHYLKLGFWDIKIDYNINKSSKANHYILVININEGERKYLKSVSLQALEECKELENDAMFANFKTLKNSIPFDIEILNDQNKYLLNTLKKKGYQNITVTPEFIPEDTAIHLKWKIKFDEPKIKFGKTIIHGNNNVSFERIMQETNFNVNQGWNKTKLEESYFNINSLNIYDTVQIYPANYVDLFNNKPVIMKLIPDDPFEIRARVGFQQVSKNLTFKGNGTYKAGGSFLYKNPFNLCDILKLDVDISRFISTASLQYRIPRICGVPFKTLFQIYLNKYKQPIYIGSDKNLYQASTLGFLTTISRKYNEQINFGLNFALESTKIDHLSVIRAEAMDFSPCLLDRRIPYFFIEPNIIVNFLDDQLVPTRGTLSVVYLKAMLSLKKSRENFLKLLFENSFFSSFLNPVITAFRVRFGYIFCQDFKMVLPPFRFYLGGSNTVRSYQPDFAPPLGSYIEDNGQIQFVPQGGKLMFNANFELRIPINAIKGLGAILFQDIGILRHGQERINRNNILTATGFGLTYATPIGPLRFDIGWRPMRFKEDCSYAWFLTFGYAF